MRIVRQAEAPFDRARMYSMVADINAYKEFLPWCADSHIDREEGDTVWATLHLSYHLFQMAMTTRNTMRPHELIAMDLTGKAGSLKSLHGEWRFRETGAGRCHIALDMDIQFSGRLPELTLGPIFEHIGGSLVSAFVRRATTLDAG